MHFNLRVLIRNFRLRNMELKVMVSSQFQCMLGNKSRPLHIEVSPEAQVANFRPGNGTTILYTIPTSYAIGSNGDQNGQQHNHKIGRKAWEGFF
jgi:hypothetical protein